MTTTKPHPLDQEYKYLSLRIPCDCPHVTIVSLDRPQKRNAIHSSMWKEIGRVFGNLPNDCRCVLLTGSGKAFCAGIDVSDLSFVVGESESQDPARIGLHMIPKISEMQACFTALEQCPVPVVALLHGSCVGAGIDLACCADVRICAPNTVFSVREVRMGLAADVGTLQRLPKITGNASWVNEVCLTGGNFDAEQALKVGLVSRVLSPKEGMERTALDLCQQIAQNSPVAVVGTKKALLYARDHTVADSLEQIISYNALALQSEDLPKSIAAAMQKQQATFPNLLPHSRL